MKTIFITIHIIFSLDFGFMRYRSFKLKVLLKSIFLLQSLMLSVTCFYLSLLSLDFSVVVWNALFLTEYCIVVVYLTFRSSQKTFYKLQKDLLSIDSQLGVDKGSYNMEPKVLFYILFSIIYKSIVTTIYCFYTKVRACVQPFPVQMLIMLPIFGINIFIVISFFYLYSVYCRLQNVTIFVLKCRRNVKAYQLIYQSLINSVENVKQTIDVSVSI